MYPTTSKYKHNLSGSVSLPIVRTCVLACVLVGLYTDPAAAERKFPQAQYEIGKIWPMKVQPVGRTLKSCGRSERAYLARLRGKTITYNGRVLVGSNVWDANVCEGECVSQRMAFAAAHPDPPPGHFISVWFWAEDNRAHGFLLYERVNARGEEVCSDAFGFSGSLTPLP